MKSFLLTLVMLSSFSSVWACYDQNLSYKVNLDNCIANAKKGSDKAQYSLGNLYLDMMSDIYDVEQAVKWYKKAAIQGNVEAQLALARMYSEGEDVNRDFKDAIKWYRLLVEQGGEHSKRHAFSLAFTYYKARNLVQAHMWMSIAEIKGSTSAQRVSRIAKRMTPSQLQESKKLLKVWLARHN